MNGQTGYPPSGKTVISKLHASGFFSRGRNIFCWKYKAALIHLNCNSEICMPFACGSRYVVGLDRMYHCSQLPGAAYYSCESLNWFGVFSRGRTLPSRSPEDNLWRTFYRFPFAKFNNKMQNRYILTLVIPARSFQLSQTGKSVAMRGTSELSPRDFPRSLLIPLTQ